MSKLKNIFEHTDCISQELLEKYISDKLASAEKHAVEKHLADCEMCSDAAEGLSMLAPGKISSITAELNRKITQRANRKETVFVSLRQYRTQLAVAASVILILGLVWIFRSNVVMKELDSTTAEKMFAEKFELPPPPSSAEEEPDNKEENVSFISDGENKKKEITKQAPRQPSVVPQETSVEMDALAVTEETGKDVPATTILGLAEKAADEDANYRYRAAESPKAGAVSTKQEARDEYVERELSKNMEEQSSGVTGKKDKSKSAASTGAGAVSGEAAFVPADKPAAASQPQPDRKTTVEKESKKRSASDDKTFAQAMDQEKGESKEKPAKSKQAAQQKSQLYKGTQTAEPASETQVMQNQTETEGKLMDSSAVVLNIPEQDITVAGGMTKYERQDYDGAVTDFESALKKNPNDEQALYYAGVSYLGLGQTDKAISNFRKILKNKNSKYYDDAQWYLSLAYIKNRDARNARANLNVLKKNEQSRYQKQAIQTLDEMDKGGK